MKRDFSHIQFVIIVTIYADLCTICKHGIDSIVMSRKILLKEDVTIYDLNMSRTHRVRYELFAR